MATISKLLQTLSFMTMFLMLANQLVHSQDVTSFTFNTFTPSTPGLTYQGGAHIPPGSTFLRLPQTDSSGLNEIDHMLECPGKQSWPELVGENGENAAKVIENENGNVNAIVVNYGTAVPGDFRCDRVWVVVNDQEIVVRVPTVG